MTRILTRFLGQMALGDAPVPDHVRQHFDPEHFQAGLALHAPIVQRSGQCAVGIKGSPRFEDGAGDTASVAERILSAYRNEGFRVLERLRGAFALVVADCHRRRALIAIDRMGIERLAWGVANERLAFGSSASDVARTLSAEPALNPQALFDFMLSHMVPAPETAFAGVQKLLPGTAIEFNGSSIEHIKYWQPDFHRKQSPNIAELREALLPTLRSAVKASRPDALTGSFLSGGLDSSTVTGLLADLQPDSAHAFSVGFGVAEFNELAYARTASRHFGCQLHEYEVTADDIVRIVPQIAATCDEPFGNSSAVPTLSCMQMAKGHGMTHLLAGDGGDELFGGNERYVSQRVFELYARLPAFLRRAFLDPLAGLLHPEDSVLPLRKFSSYVQQANIPLPERYESWNFVYRERSDKLFDGDFLKQVDPGSPLRRMHEVWNSCQSCDLLDRMLWYDWKFTLADNDLRKVSQMSELADIKVSYPMLDEDVVALSVRVPSAAKIEGKELRSFFKRATNGFLPPEIIRKKKHGFGLPFGQWLKTHTKLQELVYGSLDSLEKRQIFVPAFLKRVAAEHKEGHPGYYGYAIWDLVTLEQWLLAQERRHSISF
ncbi:MAG: asparagine synthase-related protein [Woeseia sp.]